MKYALIKARVFVKAEELGEATEEQGIEALKAIAPYLDKIATLESKDLASIADLFVCMGSVLSERLFKKTEDPIINSNPEEYGDIKL